MVDLTGKVALITGASSGIGAATARLFAAAGVKVGLAARRADRLGDLQAEIVAGGGQALVLVVDVADKASVEAGVQQLLAEYGALDIVFNNAGVMPLSDLDELKTDEWDQMVDINLRGVLNVTAAVLPQLIKQHAGHIINTSSIAGRKIFGPGFAVYCATKFAVSVFTEGLRMEMGKKHNIRVTSIQPGGTATELTAQTSSTGYQEMMASAASHMRALDPEDIARTVVFAAQAPAHVNIAEVYVLPTEQV